jgi:hypothetical protein
MSYGIYLESPPAGEACGHCGGTGKEPGGERSFNLDWNYTSNCAWMWREAGANLADFDGDPAGECAPLLKVAIDVLEADPEHFRAGNPKNGWGDYDSLVASLKRLLEGFEDEPHLIVRVSR